MIASFLNCSEDKNTSKKNKYNYSLPPINQTDKSITWRCGVAIKNNKAIYFDPRKMDIPDLFISPKYAKKINSQIIKAGKIVWIAGDPIVFIWDVNKSNINVGIPETEIKLLYNIKNNTTFISENGNDWSKLYIKIIDRDPPKIYSKSGESTAMVIYLKCKYFEGMYDIPDIPSL